MDDDEPISAVEDAKPEAPPEPQGSPWAALDDLPALVSRHLSAALLGLPRPRQNAIVAEIDSALRSELNAIRARFGQ